MTLSAVEVLVNSEMHTVQLQAGVQHGWWPRIRKEDFVSAGNEGLVRAARRFDPARGHSFAAYALPFIRGEMRRLIARETGQKPDPELEAMEVVSEHAGEHQDLPPLERGPLPGFDDTPKQATAFAINQARMQVARMSMTLLMGASAPLDPEALLLDREASRHAIDTANRFLSDVPPEHREVFRLRHVHRLSELEVAARLGVSERTVRRYLRRVEAAIRDMLVRAGVEARENMARALFAVGELADGDAG